MMMCHSHVHAIVLQPWCDRCAEMHDLFEEDLLPRFPHLRVHLQSLCLRQLNLQLDMQKVELWGGLS